VNEASEGERLPPSIGGLVDFAFTSYAGRAPLYLGLALFVFLVESAVEFALPAAQLGTPRGDLKQYVLEYAALFADSYVIAAVALGIGARLAGEQRSSRHIAAAALARWLPVLATAVIVQAVIDVTFPVSGLGALPDPPALVIFTAPVLWLLWGMLSLALPIAALADERPAFAVFAGLTRAISFSLRAANLPRLVVVAFISIIPNLLLVIVRDAMLQHHLDRPIYLSIAVIDALTVGLIAALQTVFAIDFARRAADQRSA
jgi:hypothetical protein